jgi:hypothetical protein
MKNQKISSLSGIIALALLLSSCEEVIDLELKNSASRMVVESLITDNSQPVTVKLSKSADFYSQSEMPSVSGALVIINDVGHITDTLVETKAGVYCSSKIVGIPGHTYHLTIIAENLTVTATSTMPQKVSIDSLDYEWGENPKEEGYMVNLWFDDPSGIKNYYRIKLMENGEPFKDIIEAGNEIILQTDKIWDGKKVHIPVKQGGRFFEIGDTVTVNFANLDQSTYDYYSALRAALAIGKSLMSVGKTMIQGSAAPANPNNVFSEDVLGYFGTAAVSSKTIVIK